MENQSADLNTLSCGMPLRIRVHERSMGYTPGAAILLGIEALDESHHVRCLAISKIPLVSRIGLDRVRLALAIRIYQLGANKIAIGDGMSVCDGQGTLIDRLNGTPDVDYLVSAIQKLVSFVRKVV